MVRRITCLLIGLSLFLAINAFHAGMDEVFYIAEDECPRCSGKDTHEAIDLISKEVVICDWHYERADPTAAIFALKGFRVITCPWRSPEVTREQLRMMESFRANSVNGVKERYFGLMQTVWSPASAFLDQYYDEDPENRQKGQVGSLNEIIHFYSHPE